MKAIALLVTQRICFNMFISNNQQHALCIFKCQTAKSRRISYHTCRVTVLDMFRLIDIVKGLTAARACIT